MIGGEHGPQFWGAPHDSTTQGIKFDLQARVVALNGFLIAPLVFLPPFTSLPALSARDRNPPRRHGSVPLHPNQPPSHQKKEEPNYTLYTQQTMPTARNVSLVQKLKWHVSGNISPTAFAIGDVDGRGDNAFVIGNLVGELFIFKGNHPEGLPWMTCKGLGTVR
ncbi:hypothetical protein EDD21DRAFT_120701 [Dissophora ornata]|nr:hypothetical protein EDD21DRAFT_120701 [Dissophora ornata]